MADQPYIELSELRDVQMKMTRFFMAYRFVLEEMVTKIDILQEEFEVAHDYSPIEHTKSRLKSPESIIKKVRRKNLPVKTAVIREEIRDIAGIRITCSFRSDIYEIRNMLLSQQDIELVDEKDYIEKPKPNGYQSLHMIVRVPVFMSDHVEYPYVEVQIRTIAMDFWASLEHKIYYKYEEEAPKELIAELTSAAEAVDALDKKMERIHQELHKKDRSVQPAEEEPFDLPEETLERLLSMARRKPSDE
ncbi:GTP pyrophosphokinase [Salisediminibacterium halotolerans]|uniref:GTP pyrophosphokinase n=1 Tax=Salisediminibacterium halotolerans TaxID=517425 RepID=UPI000EAC58A8|nr:GTP pyrophosphokinase family protein [Salisediminibacterium halotolerans]RLJ72255.1 putative GTP pyrophosphokinase [Actinophytocola xinjiangensis]RPE85469.1 putative GTP pyrophosphokinase [Salisediminibacterium halotolerans]TWG33424.1 putative GTP pyrophosphokinase [Salisediminibacterium halotolerans]GEL07036.1 GTP pyrophosphokinase [Salisediminibacterium halotolerans]